MTPAEQATLSALDQLRQAVGELFGAERRLRGRDQGRDLTHSQLRALMVMDKEQAVTAGSLARSADLHPASVTAMLDQLETSGIVVRRRSEEDRRVCLVSLTDAGRAIVEERRSRWQALWDERLGHLPAEQIEAALEVLRTVAGILDDL